MTVLQIPEILAPAGGREQFFAALHSGADAVYLGMKKFNARARAENFSCEDLAELVPLAHQHGMKVLVTLNILIKEEELAAVVEQLVDLERLRVDAVIVQDLGVVALIQRYAPGLRIHGSTQMAIHNLAGVLQAQKMGLSRVVLAREMTATELGKIRRHLDQWPPSDGHSPIELEVFCHGSLCYSYSGLCFFSGSEDSRSGNRGECAYTCRKPYRIVSEDGHGFLFSMRDLDTSNHLDQLVKAGIHTLKIEGRKKDAQYVTSTVRLYRQKMDEIFGTQTGRQSGVKPLEPGVIHELKDHLDLSFQRARTTFFLEGRYHENVIDLDHATHQGLDLGPIEQVTTRGPSLTIQVTTQKPLSRFDGLRIVPQDLVTPTDGRAEWSQYLRSYNNDHVEFSLRDYHIQSKDAGTSAAGGRSGKNPVFDIPAGTTLNIVVPIQRGASSSQSRQGRIKPGDRLFKVRSQALKEQVAALTRPPRDHRPRGWFPVDLRVVFAKEVAPFDEKRMMPSQTLQPSTCPEMIRGFLHASLSGETWFSHRFELPCAPAQGPSTFADDLKSEWCVFGDVGLRVDAWGVENVPEGVFVNRAALKAVKRAFTSDLGKAYDAWVLERRSRFFRDRQSLASSRQVVLTESSSQSPMQRDFLSYVLKTDDLDLLESLTDGEASGDLTQHVEAGSKTPDRSIIGHPICEVIFEPKKGKLHNINPNEFISRLSDLAKSHGFVWRLALPTVMRGWDEPLVRRWTTVALERGCRRFEVGNLGVLAFVQKLAQDLGVPAQELDLHGDFTLYGLNSAATMALESLGLRGITLSVEDDKANIQAHLRALGLLRRSGAIDRDFLVSLIAYKDTPLFIAEACGLTALHGGCPTAKVCGYRTLEVENDAKERFFVAHETCKSIVYGARAMSITQHLKELYGNDFLLPGESPINRVRLDFLTRPYQRHEVVEICHAAFAARPLLQTHDANFSRRLL